MIEYFKKTISNLLLFEKRKNDYMFSIGGFSSGEKYLLNYEDLFLKNPVVRRCINLIASSVSSYDFEIYRDDVFVKDSLLNKIFKNPNDGESWSLFCENLITNYLIYGDAYVLISLSNDKNKYQLNILQSQYMKVVPGNNNLPEKFEYRINSEIKSLYCDKNKLPYVSHFKSFNPDNHWNGISALSAAKVAATLQHSIDLHNLAIVTNGGRASGVICVNRGPNNKLTEEEVARIKSNLIAPFEGFGNAGKVAIVDGAFEWKEIGTAHKDMDYKHASMRATREIAAVLGVPPILIGEGAIDGESSRSSMETSLKMFDEYTIKPLVRKMFQFLTTTSKILDESCEIRFIKNENIKNKDKEIEKE